MAGEKELFLREKIFSLYMFIAKTVVALSSSTLAFSTGIQGYLSKSGKVEYEYTWLLLLGWVCLLFSLGSVFFLIKSGLLLQYQFHNNIMSGNPENSEETGILEKKLQDGLHDAVLAFLAGVCSILAFVFVNL